MIRHQSPPATAIDAGGMGLVQQQHGFVAHRQRHQIGQRGAVAVHAVKRFPAAIHTRPLLPARRQPRDGVLDRGHVIVRCFQGGDARGVQPVAQTGMDERVVDDEVPAVRQGRGQRRIGGEAVGK